MARDTNSESKLPAAALKNAAGIDDLILSESIMHSCTLERSDNLSYEASEGAEPFYDAVVRIPDENHTKELAICYFSAGIKLNDVKVIEISATYFIRVGTGNREISRESKRDLLKKMTQASMWPRFRDLFAHIGSQSGYDLALLPRSPEVRIEEDDEREPATPEG